MTRPSWLRLAALFAIVAAAFAAGGHWGRAPLQVELAQFREMNAENGRLAAMAAAKTLQDAQVRGDELTALLGAQQGQIDRLTKEKRYAIAQATTTSRACLGGAALRVLDGAPGLRVATAVELPQATGGLAAAGGPVATDSGQRLEDRWASERDIGGWAIDAGAQFEQCRARLNALIDWHTLPHAQPR